MYFAQEISKKFLGTVYSSTVHHLCGKPSSLQSCKCPYAPIITLSKPTNAPLAERLKNNARQAREWVYVKSISVRIKYKKMKWRKLRLYPCIRVASKSHNMEEQE